MNKIIPVIMCGGAGTRVWPASRETMPKQFIPLLGKLSTFQETLLRLDREIFAEPAIVTNHDYRFLVQEQMKEIGVSGDIVLEPERRDSAAAVAVGCELASQRATDAIVAVFAADHAVRNVEAFRDLCRKAGAAAAQGYVVTLGIKPTHPATGYGYIRPGALVVPEAGVAKVEAFVEKPDLETAERYIAEGYLWNSGNFFFRADVMRSELQEYQPEIAAAAEEAFARAERDLGFLALDREAFSRAPKISIDYAVMERTRHAAVIPADIGWSDVGNWHAVWELSERDQRGNSVRGQGVVMDGQNVHIRSDDCLTTVLGVDDVIVVTTDDAVLVLGAQHGDKVKQLVDDLKRRKLKEAQEHRRVYRPWGHYQSIDNGERHQVKRIVVKPGHKLSLQKHYHRAEHWIVVRGAAEVTRDNEVLMIHENESIYLPMGSVHRLVNPGKIDLELIEVQTGSYLGEDDIVRIEDLYHRA
ncbi:mannose-1-phosphate guanylyltransferase/mannose-6-phosphate isomerase [Rhodoblastus acidophilus]|uniref:mannose-1-phosphate guanylyltransferase n=1 Tax=Candidatus Rhodoblastus alkanivorans TaxID=2954117 RepID=A0ABS9Z138_9HYPH|nr:mannose-1-phosphate guanylyltransferase/mannose-6-phosphate isomerase [Candidatus Rhodoblastus alkanivorans]MCI4678538.1 mannose-1-phosphate guanylyltransferase/mannose-6-phosphate isomerase [Candidatus Rhodoblastus alkanivorans]MCI4681374.1 mannose-1-phosphate guanylyltransferase/mannose-6-phosphate isomerase [Candidatus Rhodoblastus alkanivorans]MDI4642422.1 mannose-1-phosphate guanylyltransferase/mannose-6-phosphate isomerase [Rhodoblastus acidophilus]